MDRPEHPGPPMLVNMRLTGRDRPAEGTFLSDTDPLRYPTCARATRRAQSTAWGDDADLAQKKSITFFQRVTLLRPRLVLQSLHHHEAQQPTSSSGTCLATGPSWDLRKKPGIFLYPWATPDPTIQIWPSSSNHPIYPACCHGKIVPGRTFPCAWPTLPPRTFFSAC